MPPGNPGFLVSLIGGLGVPPGAPTGGLGSGAKPIFSLSPAPQSSLSHGCTYAGGFGVGISGLGFPFFFPSLILPGFLGGFIPLTG